EPTWWDTHRIAARFHEAHNLAYGHAEPAAPIELVNLRLTGFGILRRAAPEVEEALCEPHEPAPVSEGRLFLDRRIGFLNCRHFDREGLSAGARIRGPALIHQLDSTVLVMPDHVARTLAGGVLSITVAPSGEQA